MTRHRVFRAQHFLLHMVAMEMRTEPEKVLEEIGLEGAIAYVSEHLSACMSRDQPEAIVALFADALAREETHLKNQLAESNAGAAESLAAHLIERYSAPRKVEREGLVKRVHRVLTNW